MISLLIFHAPTRLRGSGSRLNFHRACPAATLISYRALIMIAVLNVTGCTQEAHVAPRQKFVEHGQAFPTSAQISFSSLDGGGPVRKRNSIRRSVSHKQPKSEANKDFLSAGQKENLLQDFEKYLSRSAAGR